MKSPEDAQLQSPRQVESEFRRTGPGNSGEAETEDRLGACRIYREAVKDNSPGLQAWAMVSDRFAVKSNRHLG